MQCQMANAKLGKLGQNASRNPDFTNWILPILIDQKKHSNLQSIDQHGRQAAAEEVVGCEEARP